MRHDCGFGIHLNQCVIISALTIRCSMNSSLTQIPERLDFCTKRRMRKESCDGVGVLFDGDSSWEGDRCLRRVFLASSSCSLHSSSRLSAQASFSDYIHTALTPRHHGPTTTQACIAVILHWPNMIPWPSYLSHRAICPSRVHSYSSLRP
ncbi:hypothetical protein BDR05DRAFT_742183 [Suillus weaverae]|nr:hypothetical protein BDR05DRAFT_742183 [Suillus weaverae]